MVRVLVLPGSTPDCKKEQQKITDKSSPYNNQLAGLECALKMPYILWDVRTLVGSKEKHLAWGLEGGIGSTEKSPVF